MFQTYMHVEHMSSKPSLSGIQVSKCDFREALGLRSLGLAERLQVDAELLALFVEVAAFEAEDAGDVGHVEIVAADFGQEHFPFVRFRPFHQRSRTRAAGMGT